MLNKSEVDREEERIREQVNQLSDPDRKAFYYEVRYKVKDPDTYAALNWFFIAGLHHFYLRRWLNGVADLSLFVAGVALIVAGHVRVGVGLIVVVSVWELWALFRAQVIVQDWNNATYRKVLAKYSRVNVKK